MDPEIYTSIIQIINEKPTRDECFLAIKSKHNEKINYETFSSIYGQHKRRIFKTNQWRKAKENTLNLYLKYQQLSNQNKKPGIINSIAQEHNIPPVLMARLILEGYSKCNNLENLIEIFSNNSVNSSLTNTNIENLNVTKLINLCIKETYLIKDENLAAELFSCCIIDDDFGPCIDIVKNFIGLEYEQKLCKVLNENKIVFQTEEQLRIRGFDKTPDFKLEIPICINDKVINWVESKASFGDLQNHQQYYEDQFKGYLNRFGPGLVIYWFGFVKDLCEKSSSILINDHFPTNFTSFDIHDLV
jgi:hypothetical protein